jgi:hypothetical protein
METSAQKRKTKVFSTRGRSMQSDYLSLSWPYSRSTHDIYLSLSYKLTSARHILDGAFGSWGVKSVEWPELQRTGPPLSKPDEQPNSALVQQYERRTKETAEPSSLRSEQQNSHMATREIWQYVSWPHVVVLHKNIPWVPSSYCEKALWPRPFKDFFSFSFFFFFFTLTRNLVFVRRVDPSALAFSLSSHRHSYVRLLFSFRFFD